MSAAVICGVTARRSAASLNCTVTVLFATVWMGIWSPWTIVACTLFCVVTRGWESVLTCPSCSAADRTTSRLSDPSTAPSVSPSADVAASTPRLTAVPASSVAPARSSAAPARGPWLPPTRPVSPPRLGKVSGVVLPMSGASRPVTPQRIPSSRA